MSAWNRNYLDKYPQPPALLLPQSLPKREYPEPPALLLPHASMLINASKSTERAATSSKNSKKRSRRQRQRRSQRRQRSRRCTRH